MKLAHVTRRSIRLDTTRLRRRFGTSYGYWVMTQACALAHVKLRDAVPPQNNDTLGLAVVRLFKEKLASETA